VHADDLAAVRAQIRSYQTPRDLVDQWIDAAIELDHHRRTRSANRR